MNIGMVLLWIIGGFTALSWLAYPVLMIASGVVSLLRTPAERAQRVYAFAKEWGDWGWTFGFLGLIPTLLAFILAFNPFWPTLKAMGEVIGVLAVLAAAMYLFAVGTKRVSEDHKRRTGVDW